MSQWIKCSERMPAEISGDDYTCISVIATDGLKVVTCDFETGCYPEPWRDWTSYGEISSKEISHWMPLPQPPEDE